MSATQSESVEPAGAPTPSDLLEALDYTPERVARRLVLMGFDATDEARLNALAPAVRANAPTFVRALYDRLRASPVTAAWLHNDALVARLQVQQQASVEALFAGPRDEAYVRRCLRVGLVHHRVHLTPPWFLCTYAHFVGEHADLVLAASATVEEASLALASLVKAALFEASLILDAYGMTMLTSVRAAAREARPSAPSAAVERALPGLAPQPARRTETLQEFSAEHVEARRAFVGLDDATRATLRTLAAPLAAALPGLAERFAARLASWPESKRFADPVSLARLQRQIEGYWSELARAEFDRAYVALRTRVGLVHDRLGVAPELYLAGMAHQLADALGAVAPGSADPAATVRALVRAAFFDLGFVLDAYLEARAEDVMRTEGAAAEVLAGMPSAVAVVDHRLRVESVNPALLSMFGLQAALVQHMRLEDLVPVPAVTAAVARAVRERAPRTTLHATHGARSFRVTVLALGQGAALGPLASAALVMEELTDVSALRLAAERRGDALEHLVDAVDAVLWEADTTTWTLSLVSSPALALTGVPAVQLLGRAGAWLELLPAADRIRFVARVVDVAPGARAELLHRLRRADGAERWVRSDVARSTARPEVVYGVSVDVTAQHDEHQRRLAAVARLAGGVAHQYNNLLGIIMGALSLIEEAPLGSEDRLSLGDAMRAAERSAALTRQLLAYAQGQVLRPRDVYLNDVVEAVTPTLARMVGGSIEVVLQLDPALWSCRVDPEQLQTSLLGLVANARDAMPRGGTLTIRTRNVPSADPELSGPHADEPHVELAVVDTGTGMDATVRQRALEPFFSTKPDAVGLGLSMVHGFVTQSGGQVLVGGGDGGGTLVRLRFPRRPEPALAARPVGEPTRRTVLVVDDEDRLRAVLGRILERSGHAVVQAASAAEARLALAAGGIDLVLLDVMLGEGDSGPTLAREVHARQPALPIVFMSGYARHVLDLEALEAQTWFVAKPITREALEQVLEAALGPRAKAAPRSA